MKTKILELLQTVNPYADISFETNLLEEGVLDSLSFIFFVNELEQAFEIKIPEDELSPENFVTISSVLTLLEKCR